MLADDVAGLRLLHHAAAFTRTEVSIDRDGGGSFEKAVLVGTKVRAGDVRAHVAKQEAGCTCSASLRFAFGGRASSPVVDWHTTSSGNAWTLCTCGPARVTSSCLTDYSCS